MYGWVKPQVAVPVHGEALHLAEHAALARRLGVPEVVVCRERRPGPARAGAVRHHRRGACRAALQGRRADHRGRRPHGRRPPAAELRRHRHRRACAHRQGRPGGRPRPRAARHPGRQRAPASRWRKSPMRRRSARSSNCRARAAAIPTPSRKPWGAACARPSREHWGKKPVCHVHVLTCEWRSLCAPVRRGEARDRQ